MNKLAVRLVAGNDRLAQLVRKDQDLAAEVERLDKTVIAAVSQEPSKRTFAVEQRSRDRLAAASAERATAAWAGRDVSEGQAESSGRARPRIDRVTFSSAGDRGAVGRGAGQAGGLSPILPSVASLKALRAFARKA